MGLLSPASNRIFQSLLLKFELMRFQKMSAPCDRERAWRSCGTAREASWQNSDFNMDHRLKHKLDKQSAVRRLTEFANSAIISVKRSAHTSGWASSLGCRPETGGYLCGQDTSTLHGDTGFSNSSACWTRCQAPQTWTFPEYRGGVWLSVSHMYAENLLFVPHFYIQSFRSSTCRIVYMSFKDTGSCW